MRFSSRRRKTALSAIAAAALALPLAACGGGGSGGDAGDKKVTVWMSVDKPVADGIRTVLTKKAKAEGIDVTVQRVDNINQLIMAKLQANDAPDIAMIPQPGVIEDIVKRNKAFPIDDVVDMSKLKSDMAPGTLDIGNVDGKQYGLIITAGVKSLVFYNKKAFDGAGYTVPKSLDELKTLTDKMAADGNTPWCFGIGSEAATGWPATDWIEDLVMRIGGVEDYKKWVAHDVPFNADFVKESADYMNQLLFTEGHVAGGMKATASTTFGDAQKPMWTSNTKPGCFMLKQSPFIAAQFPANVRSDLEGNVGLFEFPPAEAGGENPVLGGGDTSVMLSDDDSTKTVMKLMSESDLLSESVKTGIPLSPFKTFDANQYPDFVMKFSAGILTGGGTFLFDGSDAMPGAVGTGTFWKQMTAWISGQESVNEALKNVEDTWPTS